jgi:hypothetical protein
MSHSVKTVGDFVSLNLTAKGASFVPSFAGSMSFATAAAA